MKHVAVVGGGIAGLSVAYELARQGVAFTLFEATARLGGTVETAHVELAGSGEFTVELGPDGFVAEKPWLREVAAELGLAQAVVGSNDAERRTLLMRNGRLLPLPEGMRMMVPTDLNALTPGELLSETAVRAYRKEPLRANELKAAAQPDQDISVAESVRRHFGEEVTRTLAAPLLAGIFGGDIEKLSAQSVMPAFVAMAREHGSLVLALQQARPKTAHATTIFQTLTGGLGTLIDAMAATLPLSSVALSKPVTAATRSAEGWSLRTADGEHHTATHLMLATPAHVTAALLRASEPELATLHTIPASSAVVVALLYTERIPLPAGFGFLVEQPQMGVDPALLAATFLHQKYPHTTPPSGMLLRIFFGGESVEPLLSAPDEELARRAHVAIAGPLPGLPAFTTSIVRRWPGSLPQYTVGHGERLANIERKLSSVHDLGLAGNAYRGVGLPDLVREGRAAARAVSAAI